MNIELKILDKEFYKGLQLPNYATGGSAGIDLVATKDYTIAPQERVMIGTGLAIHIASEQPIVKAQFNVVEEFTEPSIMRGSFGSTGA